MPSTCLICKRAKKKGDNVSMHRFPPKSEPIKRQNWLRALNLNDHEIMDHHRICSRHFQHGDVTQIPSLQLGARFQSPKKTGTQRSKTALKRKTLPTHFAEPVKKKLSNDLDSVSSVVTTVGEASISEASFTTPIGESLMTDYVVHELPNEIASSSIAHCVMDKITNCASHIDNHLVHAALTARIEYLESQNSLLKQQLVITKPLRLANIQHNDKLVSFYTGFSSYEVLLLFYEFLGPAVNNLQYWGAKTVAKHNKKN